MNSEKKQAERIFVSHAFEDRMAALRVAKAFARYAGVSVYTWGNLLTERREEIIKSDVFVILLSPKTLESDSVLAEIGAAWALEKPVVIVRTHPKMEAHLRVDVTPKNVVDIDDVEEPEIVQQILELNGAKSDAAST